MDTVDDLRSDIRKAELTVARIRPGCRAASILELLQRLDRISDECSRLADAGADLRSELARVETILGTLAAKGRIVSQAVTAGSELDRARDQVKPSVDRWWWYLDQRVAEQNAGRLRRSATGAVGAALFVAAVALVYVFFLRPDRATRLRHRYVLDGESEARQGDYVAALEHYRAARELAPGDPDINLMVGVLYEAVQRPLEAAASYTEAEALYGSEALFRAVRSQRYALLGWHQEGVSEAQAAIELDDTLALAHCALGTAHEGQGEYPEAIRAFRACADLARESQENELYVIASTRLGILLQRP